MEIRDEQLNANAREASMTTLLDLYAVTREHSQRANSGSLNVAAARDTNGRNAIMSIFTSAR